MLFNRNILYVVGLILFSVKSQAALSMEIVGDLDDTEIQLSFSGDIGLIAASSTSLEDTLRVPNSGGFWNVFGSSSNGTGANATDLSQKP